MTALSHHFRQVPDAGGAQNSKAVREESEQSRVQPQLWLSGLRLNNFRNYETIRLEFGQAPVVLVGANGAGKTNLMEAVSLLSPGKGMRRAKTAHLGRIGAAMPDWSVSAALETEDGVMQIGTGVPADSQTGRRIMRREGMTVSQADIATQLSVSWLTPQMDGVFIDSPGTRRRFLDRLVIAFDAAHIGRTNRYEKLMRERTLLISEGRGDAGWFNALEASLAETAIAITAARRALIHDLNIEAKDGWHGFPGVRFELQGDIESWLDAMPALAVEDRHMAAAAALRADGTSTLPGPHASEVNAYDAVSGTPAYLASTGQQKALLIAVVLAHARLQERRLGRPPIMLLDDVAAHLDAKRRSALFEALHDLGGQSWFSGSDASLFEGIGKAAQFMKIHETEDDSGMTTKTPKCEWLI
ncbi:MAG: DNA replication/repair protein RecF [Candidatus Puniceispirillum sp.]